MLNMTSLTTNPNRIDLDEAYMRMAEIWAKRSKANRKQVGALIVKERQIISDGYNGMPLNDADDVCEFYEDVSALHKTEPEYVLKTKPEVLHAESNAITKLAANGGLGGEGATLYVTMSPCFECAKLIKQTRIKRVVYREQYRDTSGIDFLRNRGIPVEQLSEPKNEAT
jgi:dCMP deaminase